MEQKDIVGQIRAALDDQQVIEYLTSLEFRLGSYSGTWECLHHMQDEDAGCVNGMEFLGLRGQGQTGGRSAVDDYHSDH